MQIIFNPLDYYEVSSIEDLDVLNIAGVLVTKQYEDAFGMLMAMKFAEFLDRTLNHGDGAFIADFPLPRERIIALIAGFRLPSVNRALTIFNHANRAYVDSSLVMPVIDQAIASNKGKRVAKYEISIKATPVDSLPVVILTI